MVNWKLVESIDAYEKSAALNPTWSIHNSLGIAYYKLNDHKHAIENYLNTIELDPNQAIFMTTLDWLMTSS
jgi:tetratricopeptide (TPR) repeat protein